MKQFISQNYKKFNNWERIFSK